MHLHAMVPGSRSLYDALADSHRIERELGAGGRVTFYLVREAKRERPVARG